MKINSLIQVFVEAGLLCLLVTSLTWAQSPSESELQERGICARVRIRISQDVVLTRDAFRATLEISNSSQNVPLEQLSAALTIQDAEGEKAGELFSIRESELEGPSDANGESRLKPGSSARTVWTIIPGRKAAEDGPTRYEVGGLVRYRENDTDVEIPLLPATVLVRPDPRMELDYFLPRQVYGDDPFTKDVQEKLIPYSLGLLIANRGKGTADAMTITSAQPRIIENEKGLLVDFSIIATRVNDQQVAPSLRADVGSVEPGEASVVVWTMKSSLEGRFIDFEADFEHVDALGHRGVSLIDEVREHELAGVVKADAPQSDGDPDFLANEVEDPERTPETLFQSDGSTAMVSAASQASLTGSLGDGNRELELTGAAPEGFVYIRIDDPSEGRLSLQRVVRSDGKEIENQNFWTTRRTVRPVDRPSFRESKLHLFDHIPSNSFEYTLYYHKTEEPPRETDRPAPPRLVAPDDGEDRVPLPVTFQIATSPEPASEDHAKTQWQVSTTPDFSELAVDIQSVRHRATLPLPSHALAPQETYLWRARLEDRKGRKSPWTEPFQFTTSTSTDDRDAEGVLDDPEAGRQPDGRMKVDQAELRCIDTVRGEATLCIETPAKLTFVRSAEPEQMQQTGDLPDRLPFGLVELRADSPRNGEPTPVTVHSSKPIPEETRLYLYDVSKGWMDMTENAAFVAAETSVQFDLTDGGPADLDGVQNGLIVATFALEFSDPDQGALPGMFAVVVAVCVVVALTALVAHRLRAAKAKG